MTNLYLTDHPPYLRSRIRNTSSFTVPRPITNRLLSGDVNSLQVLGGFKNSYLLIRKYEGLGLTIEVLDYQAFVISDRIDVVRYNVGGHSLEYR